MIIRKAKIEDAVNLAELVNMAGDGMPYYLWSKIAGPDEDAWEIGRQRAMREEGAFSYKNAFIGEENGEVLAAMIGYALADSPDPTDYQDMPPMFVPLQELEGQVPGSWYINVIAAYPEFRGKGSGSALMNFAESLAIEQNKSRLSLIVSNASHAAMRLYSELGFAMIDKRPMVKEDWQSEGTEWQLMTKSV